MTAQAKESQMEHVTRKVKITGLIVIVQQA
jgi:hypothetical protein